MLSLLFAGLVATSRAQEQVQEPGMTLSVRHSAQEWERYDWLSAAEQQKRDAQFGVITASTSQNVNDPFSVLSNGSLWQQRYGVVFKRKLSPKLTLNCESNEVTLRDGVNPNLPISANGDGLSRTQKMGLEFQPITQVTIRSNVYNSVNDVTAVTPVSTNGTEVSAETRLPYDTNLAVGMTSNETGTYTGPSSISQNSSYNAQISKSLGKKIPVTAFLKGQLSETTSTGALVSRTPTLEQSFVWKPLDKTTIQFGLRQQQAQNYQGATSSLNETVFADWTQNLMPTLSWHSYAEVLNSQSNLNSPDGSAPQGTVGTMPGMSGLVGTNSLSNEDKTLTFRTGPSIKLPNDFSATIEYSNRWDQNPDPGAIAEDQRVSVSLKGSF